MDFKNHEETIRIGTEIGSLQCHGIISPVSCVKKTIACQDPLHNTPSRELMIDLIWLLDSLFLNM